MGSAVKSTAQLCCKYEEHLMMPAATHSALAAASPSTCQHQRQRERLGQDVVRRHDAAVGSCQRIHAAPGAASQGPVLALARAVRIPHVCTQAVQHGAQQRLEESGT